VERKAKSLVVANRLSLFAALLIPQALTDSTERFTFAA
jgi:hypothetical protein